MKKILTTIFLSVIATVSLSAQTLKGTVKEVIDGNTIVLETPKAVFKVRLQFIDPPEASQPLHDIVIKHLSSFALNKPVSVVVNSLSAGHHVGRVLVDGRDLSMQLLRDGAAWYSHPEASSHKESERNEYLLMETQAKAEKRGIWGVADTIPAWKLRVDREKAAKERMIAEREEVLERIRRSGNRLPTKPVVGMVFIELEMVCGSHPKDLLNIVDSKTGRRTNVSLQFTPERENSMCFGFFSFAENGKLDYISRSNY